MKRRQNLTPSEKAEIAFLREKGWGLERLAEKFSCSVGSISWCCLMAGASPPGSESRRSNPTTKAYERPTGQVRPFTPEEDRLIEEMRANGSRLVEIAGATGRRHNSVVGRLATLAKRKEREE